MTANTDIAALVTRLRAAYEAATPGEWEYDQMTEYVWCGEQHIAEFAEVEMTDRDGFFTAAAHNALPDLLDALTAVAAERDALREREARVRAAVARLQTYLSNTTYGLDDHEMVRWEVTKEVVENLRAALDGDTQEADDGHQ